MRVLLASLLVLLLLAAPAAATPRTGPVQLGTALNSTAFGTGNAQYRAAVGRYGAVTAESAMKLDALQPSRGQYAFADADALVDWARGRGMAVHGHTLIWCNDAVLPSWLSSRPWTRAELLAVMEDHIATVMDHFAGRVPAWDVVNEAFAADGARRNCLWQRVIGDDWIERAFRAASEADPTAELFYNETRVDVPNAKFLATEAMAQDFVARGVPLDGVGLQYHLLTGHGPLQFLAEDAMRRIGALGLRVHVSEMDGVTSVFSGTRAQKLDQQAQAFQTVASACQAIPACFRITMWGASDQWSWRGLGEMALLLDEDYDEKPGWWGVHEEIRAPAPPLQQPPTAPGPPTVSAAVNTGVFSVSWAPAMDPEGDAVSYAVQHRDADDADWSTVATGVRFGTSFAFAAGRLERQGTYRYRVRASDGRARGAWAEGSVTAVVDRTDPAPPAIAPDRAPEHAGGGGWYRDSVVLSFAGAGDPPLIDGSAGSGVDPASVPGAQTFSATGSHTASRFVSDRAGNASATASRTVQVDASAPAASLACPAPVDVGGAAAASWTASDAGAGLAGAASGSLPLDTSAPGTFTARYVAADLVGHATEATCEYVVNDADPDPDPDPEPSPSPSPDPSPSPEPSPTTTPSTGEGTSPGTGTSSGTGTAPGTATPPAPPPPPGAGAPPVAPVTPRATIDAVRRVGAGGRVRLRVTCAQAPCAGRIELRGDPRSRSAAVRRLRKLGSKAFRIAAAGRATVVLRLSRRGRAVLRRRGRLPVRFAIRLAGAGEPGRGALTLRGQPSGRSPTQ